MVRQLAHVLTDSGARAVFADPRYVPALTGVPGALDAAVLRAVLPPVASPREARVADVPAVQDETGYSTHDWRKLGQARPRLAAASRRGRGDGHGAAARRDRGTRSRGDRDQ